MTTTNSLFITVDVLGEAFATQKGKQLMQTVPVVLCSH